MKRFVLLFAGILILHTASKSQCSAPAAATNIFLSAIDTAASVYYDSTSTASEYIAFMSTSPSLSTTPVNGTAYTVGQAFGGGIVVYKGGNYTFRVNGLTSNITYYFFIYSDRLGCTGEPRYSTTSLDGNVTTFSGARGVPAGYYSPITSQTCAALKTALYNIIKPAVANPDPTYKGILGAAQLTDGRINDNSTKFIVWDQYSDNPTGAEPYEFNFGSPYQDRGTLGTAEGQRFNREHLFPQSWFVSNTEPMYSDMFIVYPSDKYMNSLHSNYPYGIVGGAPVYTSLNGTKTGNNTSSPLFTTKVFEPINAYKGDIARAYFYVVTAYENLVAGWVGNSNASDVLDGTSYPALKPWQISLLYQWHQSDPVSQKEIDRNNNVYMIQGARNPYIDHPEYVALVWQCTGLIPVTLTDFRAVKANDKVIITWQATHEANFKDYQVERSINGTDFSAIGTVHGQNLFNYNFNDNSLPNKSVVYYRLKLIDADGKIQYSKIVSVRLNNNLSNAIVYPNPTSGKLNIQLVTPLVENSNVSVIDVTGRKILSSKADAGTVNVLLNVSSLPAGRYIVTINNSVEVIKESFVVGK